MSEKTTRYQRLREAGLCTQCGKVPAAGRCDDCRARANTLRRARLQDPAVAAANRARATEWNAANPERRRANTKRSRARAFDDALAAYGARCACCGESERMFLTIDHVNNDGAEHRRDPAVIGSGLYSWLRRHGYPPGFQTLCWNCNCGRHRNGGVCPHRA